MNYWTIEEDTILINNISKGKTFGEISALLNDRSIKSVQHRWNRIKNRVYLGNTELAGARHVDVDPVTLSTAVFDIEVMDFDSVGYTGHLVSMSWIGLNEDSDEPHSLLLRYDDDRNDRRLLIEILDALSQYDILIGHNIAAFDLNWLASRAMYYSLAMPKVWLYYDTYQVAKTLAIKSYKGLGPLGAYFGLQGTKTAVFKPDWSMIDSPIRAEFEYALAEIDYHCKQDVILNRELFNILWNYDRKRSLKTTKW